MASHPITKAAMLPVTYRDNDEARPRVAKRTSTSASAHHWRNAKYQRTPAMPNRAMAIIAHAAAPAALACEVVARSRRTRTSVSVARQSTTTSTYASSSFTGCVEWIRMAGIKE